MIYTTHLSPDGYDTDKLHAEMDKIRADLPEYWQRYRRIELAKRQNEEARLASKGIGSIQTIRIPTYFALFAERTEVLRQELKERQTLLHR